MTFFLLLVTISALYVVVPYLIKLKRYHVNMALAIIYVGTNFETSQLLILVFLNKGNSNVFRSNSPFLYELYNTRVILRSNLITVNFVITQTGNSKSLPLITTY